MCNRSTIRDHSIIHHVKIIKETKEASEEEVRGGRGFGGGRGPVVCHNCQKPGHYARDCPQPPVTCMYCRATDHETEDCLTLLVKIQDKRNQEQSECPMDCCGKQRRGWEEDQHSY
jgi:hypothetical protein